MEHKIVEQKRLIKQNDHIFSYIIILLPNKTKSSCFLNIVILLKYFLLFEKTRGVKIFIIEREKNYFIFNKNKLS